MKGLISFGLGFVGLGIIATALFATFVGNIKYAYSRNLLINLLRTQPNRAEMLCRKSTGTFMDAIGAAMKACASCGTTDIKVLVQASKPSYDAGGTMVGIRYQKLLLKAKLGLMACAGGFVLGVFGGSFSVFLLFLALLGTGGFLWLIARKVECERSIARARVEVLPEVERAFAEGRYIKMV